MIYDLIIVGAGPAGLTAGIYAARYNLKTLIIGKLPGGMISEAHRVCNFPSHPDIGGMELGSKMTEHVKSLGVKIEYDEVVEIKKNETFSVKTNNNTYNAKKIIIAAGTIKRKLNVKGEKEFLGRGVSYCATCDAAFFKDKTVAVVGGSNSALTAALLLAEHAKKVYLIYRKDKFFRAEPAWVIQVDKNGKIEVLFNTEIEEINGSSMVEEIKLNTDKNLKVDGVFVEIGSIPNETFSKQLGLKTDEGYIIVDDKQQTNINGVFAAGDITNNTLKQVITACAEGAVAANSVYDQINSDSSLS